MEPIDVNVNHIKIGCAIRELIEQDRAGACGISARPAQSQGTWNNGHEFGSRAGVTTGEQGHIMAELNKLLGEP